MTTVTAESLSSARLEHTKFYGYGGICYIAAAVAHETLSSGLAAAIQRHVVGCWVCLKAERGTSPY